MKNTKERILDTAERLFAEKGFDATSLRTITAQAEANLASVNYYFNSKDALIHALCVRKLGALNRQRTAMLDQYAAEAGDDPIPLEKVMRAFIEPVWRSQNGHANGIDSSRLLGRIYSENSENLRRIVADELRGPLYKFGKAFQRALPDISFEELYWRMFFTIGILIHTIGASRILEGVSNGLCKSSEMDKIIERIIPFAIQGMQTPCPAPPKAGRRRRQAAAKSNTRTTIHAKGVTPPAALRGH